MPSVEMDVQPCLVGAVHPPLSMQRCAVLPLLRLEHDAAVVKEPNAVPLLSMDPPEAVRVLASVDSRLNADRDGLAREGLGLCQFQAGCGA